MDTLSAIAWIKLENKPYTKINPPMAQSTFSNTIRAINAGTAKITTITKFMNRFGLELTSMDWIKFGENEKTPIITEQIISGYSNSIHDGHSHSGNYIPLGTNKNIAF